MEASVGAPIATSGGCPNCWRAQQTADRRWVEIQQLRARLMGFEGLLSEYLWLVSESAASELDQDEWRARVDQARSRALELLELEDGAALAASPAAPTRRGAGH
ncbi:MAG TPA: hypothetical protein VFB26_01060 [Gaiellaceae bacterium]|nr:hypothetical protein [Gaiellaceae bacterium]